MQPCRTATLNGIPSLGEGFTASNSYDSTVLAPLSFMPQDVTTGSVSSVVEQLQLAKQTLRSLNIEVSLELALKQVFITDQLRCVIPKGMQHLCVSVCPHVRSYLCDVRINGGKVPY